MSQFEAICTFMLFFTIMLGIGLGINFHKNKKVFIGVIISSITIIIVLILLLFFDQKATLQGTIKDMIHIRNGIVISIAKVEGSRTPFGNEVEQYNSVYEIQYRIENKFYTAWYRSVDILVTNVEEDLTSRGRSSARFYKEAWIFNE